MTEKGLYQAITNELQENISVIIAKEEVLNEQEINDIKEKFKHNERLMSIALQAAKQRHEIHKGTLKRI